MKNKSVFIYLFIYGWLINHCGLIIAKYCIYTWFLSE